MSGPTFPVSVPNEGELVNRQGDQKIDKTKGLMLTHNGNQTKWKDRLGPAVKEMTDNYVWEVDES